MVDGGVEEKSRETERRDGVTERKVVDEEVEEKIGERRERVVE